MLARQIGRAGIDVSALGMGCWAIGGPFSRDGRTVGWGQVDDAESIRAIHRALDLGVTFFDTADIYGAGHSERVLGQALTGRRDTIVIATKFGQRFEEHRRLWIEYNATPIYIREACDASLRRLNTDYIDLYQFHINNYDLAQAGEVRDTLEGLVSQGKIRAYGWSTDDLARARFFAEGAHCVAIQHRLNLVEENAPMVALCEELNLASINRAPLAMGVLTGKFDAGVNLPPDDVRAGRAEQFGERYLGTWLRQPEALRTALTRGGRTLAQAALGWLWARSDRTIPIPGFKTVAQVEDNAGALRFGPLSEEQMAEITALLAP